MMRESDDKRAMGRARTHSVSMDARERVVVTGAQELLSFNDMEVCVDTPLGVLAIEGEELHIERLNLDEGQVIIRGYVYAANYDDDMNRDRENGGLIGRLFRK